MGAQNWFLTWGEDDEWVKSFLLQIEGEGISHGGIISDTVNSFAKVERSSNGAQGPWELVGETNVLLNESNPQFAEGFRLLYEQSMDLAKEMIQVSIYQKHDKLVLSDARARELLGEARVTFEELFRTFGTKLKVELLRGKTDKICGRVQLLGEALPATSPRGGRNTFEFNLKLQTPPTEVFDNVASTSGTPRMYATVSRERADGSWSLLHRTGYVRKGTTRMSRKLHSIRGSQLIFEPFTLMQQLMILDGKTTRPLRLQFMLKGKNDEENQCIGYSYFSVDELINDMGTETSVDFFQYEEILGEFAVMERIELPGMYPNTTKYVFEANVLFFNEKDEAKKARKVSQKTRMRLDQV